MISDVAVAILKETEKWVLYLVQRGTLEGHVVGQDEEALANVKVTLKSPNGRLIEADTTFLSGRFIFPRIKEGKYELFAECDSKSFAVDKVYLKRGIITSVKVKLPKDGFTDSNVQQSNKENVQLELETQPVVKLPFTQNPFPGTPHIRHN